MEIASDYVKKKNVFQLTTASESKFLFQADDTESMSNWVKAIQTNSELKKIKENVSLMFCSMLSSCLEMLKFKCLYHLTLSIFTYDYNADKKLNNSCNFLIQFLSIWLFGNNLCLKQLDIITMQ